MLTYWTSWRELKSYVLYHLYHLLSRDCFAFQSQLVSLAFTSDSTGTAVEASNGDVEINWKRLFVQVRNGW